MSSEGVFRIERGAIKSTIKREKDIIPLKLNTEEKELIINAKRLLEQSKTSTTIKQLMFLGYKSITSPEIQALLNIIYENKRKNKRAGIVEYEV